MGLSIALAAICWGLGFGGAILSTRTKTNILLHRRNLCAECSARRRGKLTATSHL